jgi:hypothetical protein
MIAAKPGQEPDREEGSVESAGFLPLALGEGWGEGAKL